MAKRIFEPRRELGRTGFKASRLGIGDLADRQVPLAQCVATVHRAMEAGLNVIDTAPGYEDGYSEEIVGAALSGGRRAGMFVIDKIDHHEEPVGPQVAGSLERLGLESIDAFVFHGVSDPANWERISARGGPMDELGELRAAGKCRFRGISCHHPEALRAAILSGTCDVLLFAVGPHCDPRYAGAILPLARQHGVGTVCFKTFGAGKLLGDTEGYSRPLSRRPRGKLSSGGSDEAGQPRLPRLSVGECVRYTLTADPDVALLGLSFPNEQDAAFAAARDFQPMTPEEMEDLRRRAAEAVKGKGRCWWDPGA
jgi:aryl-alcohol dehydrogenase-like predicted oxidoreductase